MNEYIHPVDEGYIDPDELVAVPISLLEVVELYDQSIIFSTVPKGMEDAQTIMTRIDSVVDSVEKELVAGKLPTGGTTSRQIARSAVHFALGGKRIEFPKLDLGFS